MEKRSNSSIDHAVVTREAAHFVGITTRVEDPPNATFVIGALWDLWYREFHSTLIPHAKSHDFYGLYYDYAGDYTKPYTFMIGCEVTDTSNIPDKMEAHTAEEGKYGLIEIFGLFPDNLIETWKDVWASDLKRAYKTDIEHYGPKFHSSPPQVDLYISLKI